MSVFSDTPPYATGYLLFFRNTSWEKAVPDAELRAIMKKVDDWFGKLAESGKIVSAQPLFEEGVTITGKGGQSLTDGPFAEAKEVIGGYVQLNVKTMEEAVAIAKSNPMHDYGLITEVRATASACPHTYRILRNLAQAAA